jgi:uncharacterized protein YdeI (BOF family)
MEKRRTMVALSAMLCITAGVATTAASAQGSTPQSQYSQPSEDTTAVQTQDKSSADQMTKESVGGTPQGGFFRAGRPARHAGPTESSIYFGQ